MCHLTDRDRQALRLAAELRRRMQDWLGRRGVPAALAVSPFVDPAGDASVLIRMNAHAALAMILGFEEQRRGDERTRDARIWPPEEDAGGRVPDGR
ncbi:hypothetical protein Sme01_23180 [Sphaerisporangium melleum]|uniref:Uncharacterized protein n=1 Tax=Sphaerisporangium melleum TaxID=321316 RepID=A0A917QYD9_9ACTN|nr:hypothetical protein [Sphaerisporangium melleum]GGK78205.1 hypothetical protein GCM10007964_21190 [Sphaerisporangium melleum]GII69842.1 hypothetical protein Sme01_23180 [Sphaerisporangium melleum]